ncbi:TlyA family RNA methyltransferase [Coriobacteriia bacterium Es71-Z0120]|uniref:TlyA family RNA methyltransferase n=1 Tax=Parvivirga hydrogeniphila TaxID=2939460 RepID=UPI002260CB6F|nr:TlyA family RNA methyltransferase [Parvivirga hydrogeniphila]MCL4079134.1 TlyA family RNA methyltransferase [Parvivirga hydrogeniphila]
MRGTRLDVALVERGLFPTREQARAAILAGEVRVDGVVALKPGQPVSPAATLQAAPRERYVSRGGRKLEGALEAFGIDVRGLRAIDVGASTGGFTDCLLKHGAASVVALDVGYGQLAWSLRTDERVTVIERTNVRTADPLRLGAPFDLVVCDVSFISLTTVLPRLIELAGANGQVLALVKPQFEVGKGRLGKKGVVRDPDLHREVLERVVAAVTETGWVVRGVTFSPLKGPEGNVEFWVWAAADGEPTDVRPTDVVAEAHRRLGE